MTTDAETPRPDSWGDGQNYEAYMGRWSRKIAHEFVRWLDLPAGLAWLDVGCGTGALSSTILAECAPGSVVGVDFSEGFIEYARNTVADERARFEVGSASALPLEDGAADAVVSALAFNFFPDRAQALGEMLRVAKPTGTVAFYVWDYPGGGMGFMDAFWKAAVAVAPESASKEEGARFPFCTPEGLLEQARAGGVEAPEVRAIEVSAEFADFDDLWAPFTRGTGPAPAYFQTLDTETQRALRRKLEAEVGGKRPIVFPARAWGLRGRAG